LIESGVEVPDYPNAAHHIVAGSSPKAAEARAILQRYGIDINSSLEELLNELVMIPNIYRIRLSSIEINEITPGIRNLLKNNKVMAKHLHIPYQSYYYKTYSHIH
jgi:hypothetical protein